MRTYSLPIVCLLVFGVISFSDGLPNGCNRKPCTKIYKPVCGNDMVTYSNMCMFEQAKCRNKSLKFKFNGECPMVSDEAPGGGDSICSCTREYKPLCGSDNKKYPNPCIFECARKKNKNLKVNRYLKPENNCKKIAY